MIKTFEEYQLKIEIEDSTVNFHFGHEMDDDVQLGINKEPQAGDEVMVDLPLVKLNHVKDSIQHFNDSLKARYIFNRIYYKNTKQ